MCFLNQIILGPADEDLAVKLMTIYFSFFKSSIKTNEVDSKLMSALLVGVVRAFPFAKGTLYSHCSIQSIIQKWHLPSA